MSLGDSSLREFGTFTAEPRVWRLPGAIHDLQNFVAGLGRVDLSSPQLEAADSLAERDHRLVDDHGLAVHGWMAG